MAAAIVDDLGAKPLNWTSRVNGVGSVMVVAVMKDDIIQARFALAKDATAVKPKPPEGAYAEAKAEVKAAVVGGVERPKREDYVAPSRVTTSVGNPSPPVAAPAPAVFPPVVESLVLDG